MPIMTFKLNLFVLRKVLEKYLIIALAGARLEGTELSWKEDAVYQVISLFHKTNMSNF